MCDLPFEIADEEKIVRAIMSPYHLKKDKITFKAFRPPVGIDEVSVMRHSHMGSDFCKSKAKEIAAKDPKGVKKYCGLAVLLARKIRDVGSEVQDSRGEYCGHADIHHGIILQLDEPPGSEDKLKLDERLRELIKVVIYYRDLDPEALTWTSLPL